MKGVQDKESSGVQEREKRRGRKGEKEERS